MGLADKTLPKTVEELLESGDIEAANDVIDQARGYHESALDAAILLNSVHNPAVDRLPDPKIILASPGARLHMAEYLAAWYSLGNPTRAQEETSMSDDSRGSIVRSVADHFDLYSAEALQYVYRASKANAGRRVLLWAEQLASLPVQAALQEKEELTARLMEEMHQADALQY